MKNITKDVVIRENGVPRFYSASKIEIASSTDDKSTWIPAESYNLKSIVINKNGTYKASTYGADGFGTVEVKIDLPYEGTTRTGVNYTVDTGANGNPVIHVKGGA